MTPAYFKRDITGNVLDALREMPVVVITGMRQTGKSTFLQNQPELSMRRYVTFDDFAQLEAAKLDPDGFVNADEPLTIDEAQKCPEVLTAIKRAVDKKRVPGQYLLSGSANFSILKGVTESLAGRAVYFAMHPFTRREIARQTANEALIRKIFTTGKISMISGIKPIKPDDVLRGGMPTVALGEVKNRSIWFKGYEQTYLERDIREFSQIGSIISFRHLLRLASLRTGQLLSPSELGRDAKLNAVTTSRYLALLEASFIIYRLSPYLRNRASRLIKSPKLYMSDSGLACYLAGIEGSGSDEPLWGVMFETYTAQNLVGIIDSLCPDTHLRFWNIQGRHEVDFIIEDKNRCVAIEVKAGARWDDRDLSGLKAFLSATPKCIAGLLAYNGRDTVQLGERLWAVPLNLLLS